MNFDLGRFLRDAGRLTVTGAFGVLVVVGAQQAQAQTPEGTVVQGSNSSIGSRARSGAAIGVNNAGANAGPSARSLLGGAQAQQVGDNTTIVNQESTVKSGDAVAGSQVTGVVSDGDVVVQNQNSSIGASARSGAAVSVNAVNANSGPSASTVIGNASASQFGDNTTIVNQSNDVSSGDAVAGGQVTGVVGGGSAVVQNSNFSFLSFARTGPAFGINAANVGAGPSASSFLGGAQVQQVGDNDAVLSQAARSASGDALAGSQSTGVVAGGGPNFIGGSNSAVLPFARSGVTGARNFATGGPGPSAGTGFGTTNASQSGNNSADLAQSFVSESGDGLAGSQVNGLVAQERGALSTEAVSAGF